MKDTGFLPPKKKLPRIAPTEVVDGKNRGAALSTTRPRDTWAAWPDMQAFLQRAADLARYAKMLLNLGELDGVRIFKSETVKLMTSVQTPPEIPVRRGLGWDIDSRFSGPRGEIFPIGSYGHTVGRAGRCGLIRSQKLS